MAKYNPLRQIQVPFWPNRTHSGGRQWIQIPPGSETFSFSPCGPISFLGLTLRRYYLGYLLRHFNLPQLNHYSLESIVAKIQPLRPNRTHCRKIQPIVARHNPLWPDTTHCGQTQPIVARYNPLWPNTTHLAKYTTRFGQIRSIVARYNPLLKIS